MNQAGLIKLGEVRKAHGLKGEVRAYLYQASGGWPESVTEIYLGEAPERRGEMKAGSDVGSLRAWKVERARPHSRAVVLLQLAGCRDPESANTLRGKEIWASRNALPLEEGEYFCQDVLGLEVVGDGGRVLGHVAEVLQTGSNDVYVCRNGEEEVLIPALDDVVREIDLEGGRIVVELPEVL